MGPDLRPLRLLFLQKTLPKAKQTRRGRLFRKDEEFPERFFVFRCVVLSIRTEARKGFEMV